MGFLGPIQRDHGGEESVLRDIQIAFLVVAECVSTFVCSQKKMIGYIFS